MLIKYFYFAHSGNENDSVITYLLSQIDQKQNFCVPTNQNPPPLPPIQPLEPQVRPRGQNVLSICSDLKKFSDKGKYFNLLRSPSLPVCIRLSCANGKMSKHAILQC